MKAIILAAGRGTRISRSIDGKPKCMLPLDDEITLIEYTVDLLRGRGVEDIVLILGYRGGAIRSTLASRAVRYCENPFFDVTNSIASLWFARHELESRDEYLIMNGDVFLSEEALEKILREKESPVLFYDTRRCEGADYRFHCEGDRLVNFGKHLSAEDTSGEYIGCARIDQSFVPPFLDRMKLLIGTQQHGKWWEDVLYSFSSERKIVARDIAGAFWAEVDYIEDYTRIIDFYDVRRREHHAETPAAVPRETGAKAHLLDYGLTQVK